jgi:NAD(P)H dehydrogenase (quinone)
MTTNTGGSPYGASHWSGAAGNAAVSDDSRTLAIALGKRLADTARSLRPAS